MLGFWGTAGRYFTLREGKRLFGVIDTGAVVGMILAFHEMATSGGQAEMGTLASGIYTAMTTTVAGLIVGIIAYMAYNHIVVRTNKVVHEMEAKAVEFLDLLNEPA